MVNNQSVFMLLALVLLTLLSISYAASVDVEAIVKEGDDLFKQGKLDSSIERYTKAIDMIGDASEEDGSKLMSILFKRSGIYQTKGKNTLALSDLNRAIQYNPNNVHAKLKRAKILTSLGRFEDATDEYKSILKAKPDNSEAKKQLELIERTGNDLSTARKLSKEKKYSELLVVLNRILESTPDNKEARLLRCEASHHTGDFRKVIDDSTAILKADGSNVEALYWRGKAFFSIGEKDAAIKFLQDGLKFDPESEKCKSEFKRINKFDKSSKDANELFNQQNFEASLKEINSALELEPNHSLYSAPLYLLKCKCLLKNRKGDESLKACNKAVEMDETADALYNRGETYMYLDEYDRALADFQKAREKSPNDHNIMDGIRRAQQKQKMAKRKDYYKILGVDKSATPQEVKRAFKKLALMHHPDKAEGQTEEAKKKYVEITEAYEVLSDNEKREKYDRGEDVNDPMGGQHQQGFQGGFPFGFGFQQGGHPGGGFQQGHHQGGGFQYTFNFGGGGGPFGGH